MPSNTSPATATPITALPYSEVLDLTLVAASTNVPTCYTPKHSVWYTYRSSANSVLGLRVTANNASDVPSLSIWTGTVSSLAQKNRGCNSQTPPLKSVMQFNTLAGVTYYIQIDNSVTTVSGTLLFEALAPSVSVAPAGSLLVTNDVTGYPTTILSSADGSILSQFPFPSNSEAGASLPSGYVAINNDGSITPALSNYVSIYGPTFGLVASANILDSNQADTAPFSSDRKTLFYIASLADSALAVPTVSTVSVTGDTGSTIWTLPTSAREMTAMCPTQTGTILYYGSETTQPVTVHAYDLVNSSALTDLYVDSAGTGHVQRDIAVLSNGDVLVSIINNAGAYQVLCLSAGGSVLHTYSLGTTYATPRMAIGNDDPTSFWVMTFPTSPNGLNGPTRFSNIRVSDGTVLTTFDVENVEPGQNNASVVFGPSQSCPLLVLGQATGPSSAVPPAGDPAPIRWLRRSPHANAERRRVIEHSFELDAQAGTGATTPNDDNPTVFMNWSFDGAKTFGTPRAIAFGQIGQYGTRLKAYNCGAGRDPVCEVYGSGDGAVAFVAAYLDPEVCDN